MALLTLLAQTGVAGTVGASQFIGNIQTGLVQLQFNPQANQGFTGTVSIEASNVPQPGASDWFQIAEVDFAAHTTNFAINIYESNPWLRARLPSGSTQGAVSVYAAI